MARGRARRHASTTTTATRSPTSTCAIVLAFNAPAAGFVVPNDYVAAYVARDPERLIGFGAVDPHDPGALDELERFGDLGLAGCKLGADLPGRRPARPGVPRACARRSSGSGCRC